MNFQQLRFVMAVRETGSFTKAAEQCCVTQPALSNAINQLEEELGAKLFDRTSRSVTITEFGLAVINEISNIIDSRSKLMDLAADFLDRDDATIRIGISPLISSDFITSLINRVKQYDSSLKLVLSELNRVDIDQALESGVIDYAFGPTPFANPSIPSLPIYHEPLLYVCDKRTNKEEDRVRLTSLSNHTFLLVHDDCGLSGVVRKLFQDHQIQLKEYEGRALGYHVLEKWARLGIGVALLPASKIDNLEHATGLIDQNGDPVTIGFQGCWNERQNQRSSFDVMQKVLHRA